MIRFWKQRANWDHWTANILASGRCEMKRLFMTMAMVGALAVGVAYSEQYENEGAAKGLSCHEIGYRFARCDIFIRSCPDIDSPDCNCDPADNVRIPSRCSSGKGQELIRAGMQDYFNDRRASQKVGR